MHPVSIFRSTNLILLFHSVPRSDWFRNTLRTIRKVYQFISMEEIESYYYNSKNFNHCCHICFDDGDKSVYENAFPILREMKVPATLFVSPKIIGEKSNYWFQELEYLRKFIDDETVKVLITKTLGCDYEQIKKYKILSLFRCMNLKDIFLVINTIKEKLNLEIKISYNITDDQLHEMNNSKLITIGAHTMNHPILSNETDDDAEKEIEQSIKELSGLLHTEITYFAYPNGKVELDYNIREQAILQNNNIKLAFSTDNDFFNTKTHPLNIPRSGFTGLPFEKNAYVTGKLFLVPIWDTILDMRYVGKTEVRERKEINKLEIFGKLTESAPHYSP